VCGFEPDDPFGDAGQLSGSSLIRRDFNSSCVAIIHATKPGKIIDAIGHGPTHCVLPKVMYIHCLRLPTPTAACVAEVADKLLLFAVHTDYG